MKRLRRWRSILVATLSITGLVVTVAIWTRSYWRIDSFSWIIASIPPSQLRISELQIVSCRGGFSPTFTYRVAQDSTATMNQLDYLHWHPRGVAISTDNVSAIDQMSEWKATYLFMPTTPSRLGFQFAHRQGRYRNTDWWNLEAAIPYWFPGLLFAVPVLIRASGFWKKKHSHPTGQCAACGYDLRATPDRCPECGTIPTKKKIASKS